MKKWLGVAGACIILAILFPISIPAPTYTYVVRELAQTFQSLMTFSSGLTVSSGATTLNGAVDMNSTVTMDGTGTGTGSLILDGGVGASSGNKIWLEGTAGDTYLLRDADTGCLQHWKDGTLMRQMCSNYDVPPDCDDLGNIPFGGMCKDQETRKVKIKALSVEVF